MGIFDFLFNKKKDIPEIKKEQVLPGKPVKNNAADQTLLEKVEVAPGLAIPRAFANHWDELQRGSCQAIAITATPSDDLTLEQSKFAYYPYMPTGFDYPKDAAGEFMYPLAQINFSEIPPLPGYPTSGYLQFYISAFDDIHGFDYGDSQNQKNFRVLFFEEEDIKQYKADFSFLDKTMQSENVPVLKPHAFKFQKTEEFASMGDARYRHTIAGNIYEIAARYPAEENELINAAFSAFYNGGHKIGGYAEFAQEDPRMDEPFFEEYVQLLQIDSGNEIMWGDMGVAHFFIHPDDLAKKDFSKVSYTWDCS